MTSKELVAKYRACGPQEIPVLLHFLADHWYELRLVDGQKMNDATDASLALREIAEAFRLPASVEAQRASRPAPKLTLRQEQQPRWESTCNKCGHVHQGDGECAVFLGKGGYCDCKAEVTA